MSIRSVISLRNSTAARLPAQPSCPNPPLLPAPIPAQPPPPSPSPKPPPHRQSHSAQQPIPPECPTAATPAPRLSSQQQARRRYGRGPRLSVGSVVWSIGLGSKGVDGAGVRGGWVGRCRGTGSAGRGRRLLKG